MFIVASNCQPPPSGICACFQIAYYQQYFNVDTSDVKDRLIATFTFFKAEPTFLNLIGDTPDLYGPFWIAATLIFSISVTSNLARSLENGYDYDFEVRERG
jgi:protein YIPF1/2